MRDLLLLLLIVLFPLPARTAPVTVEFEGVVSLVRDDRGLLPGISEGDSLSGFYTVDDGIPPTRVRALPTNKDGTIDPSLVWDIGRNPLEKPV